jgi:hypothetical protein
MWGLQCPLLCGQDSEPRVRCLQQGGMRHCIQGRTGHACHRSLSPIGQIHCSDRKATASSRALVGLPTTKTAPTTVNPGSVQNLDRIWNLEKSSTRVFLDSRRRVTAHANLRMNSALVGHGEVRHNFVLMPQRGAAHLTCHLNRSRQCAPGRGLARLAHCTCPNVRVWCASFVVQMLQYPPT